MNTNFPAWDTQLFLWLNGMRAEWLDPVMWFISGNFTWVPLYLLLIFVLYKKQGLRTALLVLVGMGLCVLLADRISSGLFKTVFERLRPTHEPSLEGLVHTIKGYRGGRYGFVSSHAANHFAIATLLAMAFRNRWLTLALATLALVIGYSRIYLGVHYPLDVLCGALLGVAVGLLSYYLMQIVQRKWPVPNGQAKGN